jgi:hypothetical protein
MNVLNLFLHFYCFILALVCLIQISKATEKNRQATVHKVLTINILFQFSELPQQFRI